jgi:flagellar basal-body rod protein FlgC
MAMFTTFEISAAGMNLERQRLDVAAANLANAHTSRTPDGTVYRPLRVVTRATWMASFDATLQALTGKVPYATPYDVEIQPVDRPPRLVYEPGHPDADAKGFVAYPDVNPVSEMVELMTITRAYEANVRAMNMAKTMALKALEIGGDR